MTGTSNLNQTLVEHVARLIVLDRDYIKKYSEALDVQYKWFLEEVFKMYENEIIDFEAFEKSVMGITFLIKQNKGKSSGKKKSRL